MDQQVERAQRVYGASGSSSADYQEPDFCIVCESPEVALAFEFQGRTGARIAVPAWIGLCHECILALRSESLDLVLQRSRGASLGDFADAEAGGSVTPVSPRLILAVLRSVIQTGNGAQVA